MTALTVTTSVPWPTLSMSRMIWSPAVMLAAFFAWMEVSLAFAAAARAVCVPGLPTAVTVTISYCSMSLATTG